MNQDKLENRWWLPVAKPHLIFSQRRFGVKRVARGYAVYDYAFGELVSVHQDKTKAVWRIITEKTNMKRIRSTLRKNK